MATFIVAPGNPSPDEDAQSLRKAFQGWGTDEKAIISILAHRNSTQRKLIREAYERQYQEDLIKRLESELSGDFEKAVYRWILEPADRDAVLANVALRNPDQDFHVIVEIACIHHPEELLAVRRAYQARYKHSLEEDVAIHTTGDMRKLLVGLVSSYRYQGEEINARIAKSEAEILHAAIMEAKEINHDEVIRILTTRSKPQLVATFNHYKDLHSSSITKHLAGEDDKEKGFAGALRTAIRCINDHQKYFEKVLRKGLKRTGTDEDAVTRAIVTRAEKDLRIIKDIYFKRNSVPLDHAVSKETSGDYKAFLLALLGNED